MPQRAHLRRLDPVWIKDPIYFITICCAARRQVLTGNVPATILVEAWRESSGLYGWAIGRYVIMPDHVHFFVRAQANAKPLSIFVGNWKRWTASQIVK